MVLTAFALLVARPQLPSPKVEAPFRVTDDAMIMDVVLNGAPVSLMVDTGFSGYVILREGIDVGKPTGTQELRDFVGKFTAKTISLQSLSIGGVSVPTEGGEIIQQPMRNLSASYNSHVDGILGLGALRHQLFQINFERKVVRIFSRSAALAKLPVPSGTVAGTLLPIGHNSLQMAVSTGNGQKLTMGLDTGNAFYATTHRDVLERVGLWSPGAKPKYMRVSGVASGAVESWSAIMSGATVFGIPVKRAVWDVIDLPSSAAEADGTIGFQFLRNFNITVDFANRLVWLTNFTGKVSDDPKGDVGIVAAYSPSLRRMTILDVSPETPAAKAGVREGDEPITIDGRDLSRENYMQVRKLLEGAPGTTVNLAVSRNGNLIRYRLERRTLVNPLLGGGG